MRILLIAIFCITANMALADTKFVYVSNDKNKCSDTNNGESTEHPVCSIDRAEAILNGSVGQIFLPTGVITYTGTKRFNKLPGQ